MHEYLVTVVIPCYNQGHFVDEAIQSVLNQTYQNFEIIVVNDGSTYPETNRRLGLLNYPKTTVVHSENRGLPGARNLGISKGSGDLIFPLDADDKIAPTYLEKAVCTLVENPEVGIVYSKAELFGQKSGPWGLAEYQFPDILVSPRIFCSALYRRSSWEAYGGYDEDLIFGWEDFDFFLSIIERGFGVVQLNEVLFFYRIQQGSMAQRVDRSKMLYSFQKVFENHEDVYKRNIGTLFGAFLQQSTLLPPSVQRVAAQVFFCDTTHPGKYTEDNSMVRFFPGEKWQRISFPFRVDSSVISELRIDPCERPGELRISTMRLREMGTNRVLWKLGVSEIAALFERAPQIFTTVKDKYVSLGIFNSDPWIVLPDISFDREVSWVVLDMTIMHKTKLEDVVFEYKEMQKRCRQLEEAITSLSQEGGMEKRKTELSIERPTWLNKVFCRLRSGLIRATSS